MRLGETDGTNTGAVRGGLMVAQWADFEGRMTVGDPAFLYLTLHRQIRQTNGNARYKKRASVGFFHRQ